MIDNISVKELKKLKNVIIIDIRDIYKYNQNHILNAINIPYQELFGNYQKYLNKSSKYYIYCQKGRKSMNLCLKLRSLNYDVVNITGGYEAWILNE